MIVKKKIILGRIERKYPRKNLNSNSCSKILNELMDACLVKLILFGD